VLIDASGGSGLMISPGFAREMVQAIRSAFPYIDPGIAIAGGLCAETFYVVEALVRTIVSRPGRMARSASI
jgi:hypothetical protein